MSTPSGVPQAPVSAGGVEGQAAVIGEVAKEMYSLRFDGSSYLSRTFGSGDRTSYSFSCWFKQSLQKSGGPSIFSAITGSNSNNNEEVIYLNSSGTLGFANDGVGATRYANIQDKIRDFSAWYHLTFVWNSNNPDQSKRLLFYLNGLEKTTEWNSGSGLNLSENSAKINTAINHYLGFNNDSGNGTYYSGYLANIHFIDGEALPPEATGELISDVWRPASYSGDYGVNGFHLDFDPDNMVYDSNGKLTQVKDASGNDNHWTAN